MPTLAQLVFDLLMFGSAALAARQAHAAIVARIRGE
jgi:hypothetical protein